MAEMVGIAVLFYVLGLMTKVGWISDRIAPGDDIHSGPEDVEIRARRVQ
jgi:hypothetical protein